MKISYDSEFGGQSIENVETKTMDLDAKARPTQPTYFSGTAAQTALQTTHDQFVTSIHKQLDEDQQIVDALESMMKAVHARIINTDSTAGPNQ